MSEQVERAMYHRINIHFVSGEYQYLYPKNSERAQELLKNFSDGKDYLSDKTFINAKYVTHVTLDSWDK